MAATDAALWEAVQQDDTAAFAALYERYWRRLFTAAYARLPDQAECEDIVHDIFLTLWTERRRLSITNLSAYLAAAVRYQAVRCKQQATAGALAYDESLETLSREAALNGGETRLLGLDLEGRLAAALNQLPQRCREIFLLSRIQHYSNDEIATQLHISRRSVENQLTTALRHLRLVLKGLGASWLLVLLLDRLG
jgi:RNA polymerase sigma-70 factor (ECF subfamily)